MCKSDPGCRGCAAHPGYRLDRAPPVSPLINLLQCHEAVPNACTRRADRFITARLLVHCELHSNDDREQGNVEHTEQRDFPALHPASLAPCAQERVSLSDDAVGQRVSLSDDTVGPAVNCVVHQMTRQPRAAPARLRGIRTQKKARGGIRGPRWGILGILNSRSVRATRPLALTHDHDCEENVRHLAQALPERDDFSSNRHLAPDSWWSMIPDQVRDRPFPKTGIHPGSSPGQAFGIML